MTYDEAESKEYNIPHFDEFESAIEITREREFESDVFLQEKQKIDSHYCQKHMIS